MGGNSATSATRGDGRVARRLLTPKKKKEFLKKLGEKHGLVGHAARAVGVNRSTAYREKQRDPEFSEAWEDVIEREVEDLEAVAMNEARTGNTRLIEFMLKSWRPDRYRERISIDDDREEARRRKELERASEEELDRKLAGIDDNVVPIRKASSAESSSN